MKFIFYTETKIERLEHAKSIVRQDLDDLIHTFYNRCFDQEINILLDEEEEENAATFEKKKEKKSENHLKSLYKQTIWIEWISKYFHHSTMEKKDGRQSIKKQKDNRHLLSKMYS